jgi:hypothetical protein
MVKKNRENFHVFFGHFLKKFAKLQDYTPKKEKKKKLDRPLSCNSIMWMNLNGR